MEVGFVSDLHLDFYTDNPTVDKLIRFYQNTFYGASGHTLVIAGDISLPALRVVWYAAGFLWQ